MVYMAALEQLIEKVGKDDSPIESRVTPPCSSILEHIVSTQDLHRDL